jgi:hypothetical protein
MPSHDFLEASCMRVSGEVLVQREGWRSGVERLNSSAYLGDGRVRRLESPEDKLGTNLIVLIGG